MPQNTQYIVRVQYDARERGHAFGPFADRNAAEQCVIAVAQRESVTNAVIEETPSGNSD